jgi:starch synthase
MCSELPLSVWHVARECRGVAEAGGLKDAVRGLAEAAISEGIEVRVVLPRYGFLSGLEEKHLGWSVPVRLCDHRSPWKKITERLSLAEAEIEGTKFLLVDSPRLRAKGHPYTYTAEEEASDETRTRGNGHWDAQQVNLLLQRGALEAAVRLGAPDVFHCHDGHTAFLPALKQKYPGARRRGALITVHNAGPMYRQEVYGIGYARRLTRLNRRELVRGRLGEAVEPLIVGGRHAAVNTVSPWYAEDLTEEPFGQALARNAIELMGITNGIEVDEFDPRRPVRSGIPAAFDPERGDFLGKAACRRVLVERIASSDARTGEARVIGSINTASGAPLLAYIGRLTDQKGTASLCEAFRATQSRDFCAVVLGSGEERYERELMDLASGAMRGRLSFMLGFDPKLAKLVYAGADFMVVPSVYEPCGLVDIQAQAMGTVPIVHSVGGLRKVKDNVTGFAYQGSEDLASAIDRALAVFAHHPGQFVSVVREGFLQAHSYHSWGSVLRRSYLPLYHRLSRPIS